MQLDDRLTRNQLRDIASRSFGTFVKGVIDVSRGLLVIDMSLHGDDFIEFDSMINVRPAYGNVSRGVDDSTTQAAIRVVVQRYVA